MIKIYTKVSDEIGYGIKTAVNNIKQSAPDNIEFVDTPNKADYRFVHLIGESELKEFTLPMDRMLVFFYCFKTAGSANIPSEELYKDILSKAIVMSYYPLDEWVTDISFDMIRTPIGVDTNVFVRTNYGNRNAVMTTGYVADSEFIKEMYQAASLNMLETNHVGHNFNFGPGFNHFEDVSVEKMVEIYNKSKFCNGMRYVEGLELSNIEGILCGCRPICLDYPMYRYWFNETSLFIPEILDFDERVMALMEVMLADKKGPVTEEEREYVVNRFGSHIVYPELWTEILRRIN